MEGKVSSSYLDTLGSGFDAKGVDGPQLGKAHEEEVAPKDNWRSDKRDAIGRAAFIQKRKRIARKLRRLAREIASIEQAEMDAGYKTSIEEASDDVEDVIEDEAKGKDAESMVELSDEPEDLTTTEPENLEDDEDDEDEEESDEEDYLTVGGSSKKEAAHPIEHNPSKDDPKANASAQTGDEDWISIGPGSFKDKRDAIGRAAD
jgi:hypothetical protein